MVKRRTGSEMEIKRYDSLPQEAKDIREKVFVEEQGFKEEFDAADGLSVHLVAFDCGKPVATCRFYRKADTASFVLGRIAVVKECRGRHIGARLIAYAEDMLKNEADFILIHAQTRVRSFYEKQGYTAFGEEDFEEDCPHVWMKKRMRRG